MALKTDVLINFDGGIVANIKDAYCRIMQTSGDKMKISASIGIFKDDTQESPVRIVLFEFVPDLKNSNFVAQAYVAAKQLPEFSKATDI